MGTSVPLVLRQLAGTVGTAAQFPAKALADYFDALGIELVFQAGATLAEDPTDHPDEIDEFCRTLAPQPAGTLPWPGVVLVGEMSVDGPGTNGILLDLNRRGACVVFAQSFGFSQGSAEDRFEIYAHEIGHMLNLSHSEAKDKFATAMNQWDVRSVVSDRKAIWREAIEGGSELQRTLLPAFFGNGSRRPIGLPMSAECCKWLVRPDVRDILPWGNHFKDTSGDGAEDASFGLVNCQLVLQTSAGSIAQPVDLQVQVSVPRGHEAVEIPLALDLRSGLIELYVTAPFGGTRKYRTRSRTCGTSRQRLLPGKILRRNYSLIGDANGVLFPTPGRVQARGSTPFLGREERIDRVLCGSGCWALR